MINLRILLCATWLAVGAVAVGTEPPAAAVEPGIYIPEEQLGIRIEDDVVITEDGYRLLSTGLPRTLEEVERAMNTGRF